MSNKIFVAKSDMTTFNYITNEGASIVSNVNHFVLPFIQHFSIPVSHNIKDYMGLDKRALTIKVITDKLSLLPEGTSDFTKGLTRESIKDELNELFETISYSKVENRLKEDYNIFEYISFDEDRQEFKFDITNHLKSFDIYAETEEEIRVYQTFVAVVDALNSINWDGYDNYLSLIRYDYNTRRFEIPTIIPTGVWRTLVKNNS